MRRPEIALVIRQPHPYGGGIGTYVAALTAFLTATASVTLFVSSDYEAALADPEVRHQTTGGADAEVVFVPEPKPGEGANFFGHMHLYSARVLAALRRSYGSYGPDLIEFQDYLGEAAVTIQARVTADSFLRRTPVLLRLNTTGELCAVLDGYHENGPATGTVEMLERYSLRFADRLLFGGGDVLGLYQRYYGSQSLAPAAKVRN